ncbi:MAG: nicotinate (nicotinamide) nucleotide adenylyltransferase [Phycisphaeraceae bacterium]|nr:nicotinate (nicotinamide) nucleotide adenylyltransferase [Phycisphaeraceae bacterium]
MSGAETAQPLTLIYGGSFDPPHLAHTRLPAEAAGIVGADRLLYVPAGQPPHKTDRTLSSPEDRLAMLELALADRPHTDICTWELEQNGPSYTVHTLEHLRRKHPDARFRLLLGADMAAIFYQWHRPEQILAMAEPLVMLRPPRTALDVLGALPENLPPAEQQRWADRIVKVDPIDISSTELRRHLQEGRYEHPAVTEALDPAVLGYIREKNLYRER